MRFSDATCQPAILAEPVANLQPQHLPALHRIARGDSQLVVDQPAIEADQDRRPRCAPRPRHHLPTGRGGRHRPDGPRHPRRHSPIASASVVRMTAIHAQPERKWQDRSARCAEKHRLRGEAQRFRGLIRPAPAPCKTSGSTRGKKRLPSGRIHVTLVVKDSPHRGCQFYLGLKFCLFQVAIDRCYALAIRSGGVFLNRFRSKYAFT